MFKRDTCSSAIAAVALVSLLVFSSGCTDDTTIGTRQTGGDPSGSLVETTDCKQFPQGRLLSGVPPNQDCMEYQYDGQGTLTLKHINAGFNCCPIISAEITIEDDLIKIEESETLINGGCRCLCLFDLDYEITDLPPGEYTISVIEPYRDPAEEKLEFAIDLSSAASGMHCVDRMHYPWDDGQSGSAPEGELVGYTGCKSHADFIGGDVVPHDESCIEYFYNGNGVLELDHVNAIFNCCPDEISADVRIEDDTIIIEETESLASGGCDCLCLFDLEFTVTDLEPGVYQVKVIELYLRGDDEKLEFEIDLVTSPTGRYCVKRPYNP
jgi:hypothetical protein